MASVEYQFSEWLRRFHPALFVAARERAKQKSSGVNGLGQNHPSIDQAVWQDAGILPNYVPNAPSYKNDVKKKKKKNDNGGWLSKIGDTALDVIKQAGPLYFQTKAQKDLLDINVERMKQGLEPISSKDMQAPTVRVETDVGEQVERFTTGISSTLQKAMVYGGLGLGAYFLLFHRKK